MRTFPLTIVVWALLSERAGAQSYLAGSPHRFDGPTNPYGTGLEIVGE